MKDEGSTFSFYICITTSSLSKLQTHRNLRPPQLSPLSLQLTCPHTHIHYVNFDFCLFAHLLLLSNTDFNIILLRNNRSPSLSPPSPPTYPDQLPYIYPTAIPTPYLPVPLGSSLIPLNNPTCPSTYALHLLKILTEILSSSKRLEF